MTNNELIGTIQVLKKQPKCSEAQFLIEKVASMVKPIMKSHGFKVTTLCEFFPKNANLLGINVNHGMKICLRLRPKYNNNEFLPLESVIGTMLHELTHNKFGPHDKAFYKFLDSITSELERLISQGFKGEGYFGPGYKLGGSNNVSRAEMTRVAADQAERRKVLYSGSGQRLGGSKSYANISVKDQVRRAWVRRQEDEKWCASQKTTKEMVDQLDTDDDDVIEIDLEGQQFFGIKGLKVCKEAEPVAAAEILKDRTSSVDSMRSISDRLANDDEIIEMGDSTLFDKKNQKDDFPVKRMKSRPTATYYVDLTD